MSGAASSPHRRVRKLALVALWLLLAPVLAWGAGLAWYIRLVDTIPAPVPPAAGPAEGIVDGPADGIVALTGGAERVEAALRLLARGEAPRLLLSGIGGGAELADLENGAGIDAARLAERITLGRRAHSTRGNAVETAAWAEREGIRSLIVVTAAYHMPRALLELGRALPEVALYPAPVRPQGVSSWRRLRLTAVEFTKFLGAHAGLSAYAAERRNTRPE